MKIYLAFITLIIPILASQDNLSSEDALRLATAIEQIKNYYVEKRSYSSLIEDAIHGLMKNLDEHSEYLDSTAYNILNSKTNGQMLGIGIEFQPNKDGIEIISCIANSPAAKAGLHSGDIITHINGEALKGTNYTNALLLLKSTPSSNLELTIKSQYNTSTGTISIKKELLNLFSVGQVLLEDNIAYIKIPMFTEKTDSEVEKAIEKFKKKNKLKGIIIDLRDNPGGLLDSASRVSDLFIDSKKNKKNNIIVSTKSRNEQNQIVVYATPGDITDNLPIVILINKGSASASEIMAAALHDNARAILIGQKTFGKGSIQSIIPLSKNTGIKITTGYYTTPKGQMIDGIGVNPDKETALVSVSSLSLDPAIREGISSIQEYYL